MPTLSSLVKVVITAVCGAASWQHINITNPIMHQYHIPQYTTLETDDRADSRFAPSQWETSLQSNAVSHWLGVNLESALRWYTHFCSNIFSVITWKTVIPNSVLCWLGLPVGTLYCMRSMVDSWRRFTVSWKSSTQYRKPLAMSMVMPLGWSRSLVTRAVRSLPSRRARSIRGTPPMSAQYIYLR